MDKEKLHFAIAHYEGHVEAEGKNKDYVVYYTICYARNRHIVYCVSKEKSYQIIGEHLYLEDAMEAANKHWRNFDGQT